LNARGGFIVKVIIIKTEKIKRIKEKE